VLVRTCGLLALAISAALAMLAASASAATTLDCSGATIYSVMRGSTNSSASDGTVYALADATVGSGSVTATQLTTIPGGGFANGLGITEGGAAMYAVDQTGTNGSTTVFGYDAATGTWTDYTGTAGATNSFVAGAVDPANGIYYYGSYSAGTVGAPGTATVYGFDTTTNTAIPGVIATFALPVGVGAGGDNGDFVFDSVGNLYVLANNSTTDVVGIGRVSGLPTTGSTTGTALIDTPLTTFSSTSSYNGIAFDSDGRLYVNSVTGGASRITTLNPDSGAVIAGPTPDSANAQTYLNVDLAACSLNPTLAVQKDVVGREFAGDQFGLSVTGGGLQSGNTATTSGTTAGLQPIEAGPVIAVAGSEYTVSESATNADLVDYSTTYSCVDNANGGAVVASGNGSSFQLPFPATKAGQLSPNIVCTFTNAPLPIGIRITKSADPTTVSAAGQTIAYSFLVTNTGGVPLSNVSVSDTFTSPSSGVLPVTCPQATLAPGASETCTATYAATQQDINNGMINNTSTATGTPPGGPPVVSPPSTATVIVPPGPAITIRKSADPTTVTAAGQPIAYSFLVTNTGNETLTNLSVSDVFTSPSSGVLPVTCPQATLAPGASETCTATYAATQQDIDNGMIDNTSIATGTPPGGPPVVSPPSPATVTIPQTPGITIKKSADPTTVDSAGDTITYSFVVANTGNVTLRQISVTDTFTSPSTGALPVTCPESTLAPGTSETCNATYQATAADVQNGVINNTSTATGIPPNAPPVTSSPSTATVTIPPSADLSVSKTTNAAYATLGEPIPYTIVVQNHGPDRAQDATIADSFNLPAKLMSIKTPVGHCVRALPLKCSLGTIAPGSTITITVVAIPAKLGSLTNTVSVTSPTPDHHPQNNQAHVTRPVRPAPRLLLTKTASARIVTAGQNVTYTLTVTNPSSTTLSPVTVCDALPAGEVVVSSEPQAYLRHGQYCFKLSELSAHSSKRLLLVVNIAMTRGGKLVNHATANAPGVPTQHAHAVVIAKKMPTVVCPSIRGGGVDAPNGQTLRRFEQTDGDRPGGPIAVIAC